MSPPFPPSSDATPKSVPNVTPPPGPVGTDPGHTAAQPPHAQFDNILAPPQLDGELGRLGGCRVLRLIGEGGMGFVFEAEELMPQRLVALKVMRPEIATQPDDKGRFLREANAVAAVHNDHVVTIFRVGEDCGVLFLVMPLMKGATLENRLKEKPKLPLAEAVRIGKEMAQGLAAAHAAGLIHRDIKPSNIWLELRPGELGASATGGRVKILDFGLVRPLVGAVTRYTVPGQVLGTAGYMAPEQADGQEVDARADLFSLGCILYELTTGGEPFPGESVWVRLAKTKDYDPPPPHTVNPTVSVRFSALVMRLIAKDVAKRPATAAAVVVELRAIRAEMAGGRPSPTTVANPQPGPPARGRLVQKPAPLKPRPPVAGSTTVEIQAPARRSRRWITFILLALLIHGLIGYFVRFGLPTNWMPPTRLTLDLGNGVTLVLVRIPAGTFQMGSAANDPDADDGEKPRHRVTISKPIYLGQTEVTVGQFKRFVADTNHRTEAEAAGDKKTWKDPSFTQTDLRPVVYVSWNDAQEFCTWLGKKTNEQVNLPTEAEWECSCRAGSPKSTKYHFGDDDSKLGEYAWYAENTSKSGPRPCGQKLPNAFELYDMHGNVWEWCRDGKREYTQLAETNPLGPLSAGSSRVYRGGAFLDVPRYCRVASRFDAEPSRRYDYLGFRVSVSR